MRSQTFKGGLVVDVTGVDKCGITYSFKIVQPDNLFKEARSPYAGPVCCISENIVRFISNLGIYRVKVHTVPVSDFKQYQQMTNKKG